MSRGRGVLRTGRRGGLVLLGFFGGLGFCFGGSRLAGLFVRKQQMGGIEWGGRFIFYSLR